MRSEEDIEDFFEHHGIKGMKWGVRRHARSVARVQKRVDRTSRIAEGTASIKDRALGSAITSRGAQRQLQRHANAQAKWQAKLDAGKGHTRDKILTKIGAVKLTELDFHTKGDAKAKLDGGQKAAIGILVAYGALSVGTAIAKR